MIRHVEKEGFKARLTVHTDTGMFACSECNYKAWIRGMWSKTATDSSLWAVMERHALGHQPGRVQDIEVTWKPIAQCSNCESFDIIGDDDTLVCQECQSYWDSDGTGGRLPEPTE